MAQMLVIGVALLVLGILLVVTSRNPQRNGLTRLLYGVMTFLQLPGWMKDETLVLVQGIGFLVAGLAILCVAFLRLNQ